MDITDYTDIEQLRHHLSQALDLCDSVHAQLQRLNRERDYPIELPLYAEFIKGYLRNSLTRLDVVRDNLTRE